MIEQKILFMKISTLLIATMAFISMDAQEIVNIPVSESPQDIIWENAESQYFNTIWQTETVGNVSEPTMEVFRPEEGKENGTSVVICPGGGMYLLSIYSEGNDVAKWLAKRGVTAFVLKYRLVPTGENGAQDLNDDGNQVIPKAKNLLKYAHQDALNAIRHIRLNSEKYKIDSEKIGLMGFSAGGAVVMDATYRCDSGSKPNFIAPIYAWMNIVEPSDAPQDAGPMFVACATDDPLMLAPASVNLYSDWIKKGKPAELHMFAKGGHGFGMKTQNLPSDQWIDRFGEWLGIMGFMQ